MCSPTSQDIIHQIVQQRIQGDEMFTAFEISLAVQEACREKQLPVERHREMRGTIHDTLHTYLDNGLYQRSLQNVGAPEPAYVYYPQGGDPTKYVPLSRRDTPKQGVNPNDKPVTANAPADPNAGGSGITSGGGGSGLGDGTEPQPVPSQSGGRYDVGVTGTDSPTKPLDPHAGDHGQPGTGLNPPHPAVPNGGRTADARSTLTVPAQMLRGLGFHFNDIAYVYNKQDDKGRNVAVLTKHVPSGFAPLTKYTVDSHDNVRVTFHTLAEAGVATDRNTTYDFEIGDGELLIRAHQ
jgi:hypothetical protein